LEKERGVEAKKKKVLEAQRIGLGMDGNREDGYEAGTLEGQRQSGRA